jgi:hypothetical protein
LIFAKKKKNAHFNNHTTNKLKSGFSWPLSIMKQFKTFFGPSLFRSQDIFQTARSPEFLGTKVLRVFSFFSGRNFAQTLKG